MVSFSTISTELAMVLDGSADKGVNRKARRRQSSASTSQREGARRSSQ